MTSEDVKAAVADSINKYAANLHGKSNRSIMNSDYEPPEDITGDWLLDNPDAQAAIAFWDNTMKEWRQRYGSLNGYNEYKDWWAYAVGPEDVRKLYGDEYRSKRDNFGYASEDTLYSQTGNSIARTNNIGQSGRRLKPGDYGWGQ